MRVAVTGGTGYIGSMLVSRLQAQGHDAFAVTRGASTDTRAMWDPTTGWVRPGTFEGADAVVHLSGTSIGGARWTAARRVALRSARIGSTRALVEHLRTLPQPPRVLVTASATGFYGATGDREAREDAPQGDGFLATLVGDWEREGDRAQEFGMRVVHARFGPSLARKAEVIEKLLLPFQLGLGGNIGNGQQWFSWVAAEDAIAALVFVVEHEELSGAVNVCAPGAVRNRDFTRALGRALHRPTLLPIPAVALRLLFGRGMADEMLLISQRAYPAKLLDAGFRFAYPTIDEALAASFSKTGTPTMIGVLR